MNNNNSIFSLRQPFTALKKSSSYGDESAKLAKPIEETSPVKATQPISIPARKKLSSSTGSIQICLGNTHENSLFSSSEDPYLPGTTPAAVKFIIYREQNSATQSTNDDISDDTFKVGKPEELLQQDKVFLKLRSLSCY